MNKMKKWNVFIGIVIMFFMGINMTIDVKANENNTIKTQYDLVKLDRNLIKNSSFENSAFSWEKTGNGGFANYSGAAATGNWCGVLSSNSGDASVYQVVNVKPNTEYIAKAKVSLEKEGAIAFLNVKTPDVSILINNAEIIINCNKAQEGKYQDIELKFNSGDNSQISLCVMKWIENNNSNTYQGQVYVDDMYLFENNSNSNESKYDIIWADDFNDSQLDLSRWEYELGSIRGIEQQHYVKDKNNVFLRDNVEGRELILKATNRAKNLQYNNPRDPSRKVIYNSGSIRTHAKSEFLYGRIEMKAKLPKGKSVFPAFWTLGSDFIIDGDVSSEQGYGWARCGEIDIMELIGSDEGEVGNKTVYQTLHTSDTSEGNDYKLGGTAYVISEDFYNDYHIFGIDWSKGKIEWYVDNKIVATVDYSNDSIATKCLDRPQYIQMNLAMGGAWPGIVSEGLAGTEFVIDYIYYGQNEQQKVDAQEYYKDAPQIIKCNDISIYQGDIDVLSNVIVNDDSDIDFSINDLPQFSLKEQNASSETALTTVDLLCKGRKDLSALAKLPAGEYSLYYTALPKNLKFDIINDIKFPNAKEIYKFDRKVVNLSIKERN